MDYDESVKPKGHSSNPAECGMAKGITPPSKIRENRRKLHMQSLTTIHVARFKQVPYRCWVAVLLIAAMAPSANAYRRGARWTTTASHGTTSLGDPVLLTWGFVEDGTVTNGSGGGTSDLINFLDTIHGAGPGGSDYTQRPWFEFFEESFERWGELSGLDYIYEPNDDGRNHSGFQGQLGVRADVRIAGKFIDGSGGVLAFNSFPTNGDMTLDTGDTGFYSSSLGNFRRIRNVIMHEHGHGHGMNHVESNNARFLMEPFIQTNFYGPQFDDILAAHRGYGDFYEKSNDRNGNDTIALATPLGTIQDGETAALGMDADSSFFIAQADIDFVSIDDNSDTDFFSFTVNSAAEIDVSVLPVGPTYNEGPQGGQQNPYVTSEFSNLNVALFDSSQTLLASDNSGGLGEADTLDAIAVSEPGEYFVRVQGTANQVQMYQLQVSVTETMTMIDGDFDDNGIYDCADVNALTTDIAGSGTPETFDLTGDGNVDAEDLDAWLAEAGAANLDSGGAYIDGDANLDGSVDTSDFNAWNANKFTNVAHWCDGDFNADGVIDGSDFNVWNTNKFTSSGTAAVPEANAAAMFSILGSAFLLMARRTARQRMV